MSRIVFRDFDEFADSIDGLAGRFVPTARSESDWWVDVVRVGRVAVHQFQIGGASTFTGSGAAGSLAIGIPVGPSPRIRVDGQPVDESSFILTRAGAPFTFAACKATRWSGLTIPIDHPQLPDDLRDPAYVGSLTGSDCALKRTDPQHVERGRQLISRLCQGAGSGNMTDSTTCSYEEEVVAWSVQALKADYQPRKQRREKPGYSRHRVLAKALALMERHANEPLLIEDLCRETQVSERVLRAVFSEYFNVSPARLLKVRQLRCVRAALIGADPSEDSVSAIVARFGVWDHSLFARNYKALYDESPSATLKRGRQRQSAQHADNAGTSKAPPLLATWVSYAANDHLCSAAVQQAARPPLSQATYNRSRSAPIHSTLEPSLIQVEAEEGFENMLPVLSKQMEALILQQRKITQGIREHEAQLRAFAKWVKEISSSQFGETRGNA